MDKIKVIIFEPPMCCAGGLCGPNIDTSLIEIQNTINKIKNEFKDSVDIARIDMAVNFNVFLDNWDVFEKVNKQGINALPITKVNGSIVAEKYYPDFETLKNKIEKELSK